MQEALSKLRMFVGDESAATAIEYGLIAALVSVASIGALRSYGSSLAGLFGTVETSLAIAEAAAETDPGGGGGGGGGCSAEQEQAMEC